MPSYPPFLIIGGALRLAAGLLVLSTSSALAQMAQMAQPAAAMPAPSLSRDAFLERDDVHESLMELLTLARLVHVEPAKTASQLEALCWDGVQALKRTESTVSNADVDACLNAAAHGVAPRALFRRQAVAVGAEGSAGVGLVLRKLADGRLAIDNIFPESPAAGAPIASVDAVVAVDGDSVIDESLGQSIARIRGDENTRVRLTIESAGAVPAPRHEVELKRNKYPVQSVYSVPLQGAWYVQVRDFAQDIAKNRDSIALRQFIEQWEAAKQKGLLGRSVVLDLRGNEGGAVNSITKLGSYLMPDGRAHLYSFDQERVNDLTDNIDMHAEIPAGTHLIVLIDERTGAGTEWLVESLRRHGALLVGRKTSAQTTIRTGFPTGRITGGRFEIPSSELFAGDGSLIAGAGIQPDVEIDVAHSNEKPIGKAPTWLQAWLDKDLAPALSRKTAAERRIPVAYAPPSPLRPLGALCAGSAVVQLPDEFPDMVITAVSLHLITDRLEFDVESSQDDDFAMGAERAHLREAIAHTESGIAKTKKDPKQAKTSASLQKELAAFQLRLSSLQNFKLDDAGADLVIDAERGHWIRWKEGPLAIRLSLANLAPQTSVAALHAAYSKVWSTLQSAPDVNLAAGPAVCLGSRLLRLDGSLRRMKGAAEWVSRKASVELTSSVGKETQGDMYVADNPDRWLFEWPPTFRGETWPELRSTSIAGLEGVTRKSIYSAGSEQEKNRPRERRVIRTVSRSPSPSDQDWVLRAGIVLTGESTDENDRMESAWRTAVEGMSMRR